MYTCVFLLTLMNRKYRFIHWLKKIQSVSRTCASGVSYYLVVKFKSQFYILGEQIFPASNSLRLVAIMIMTLYEEFWFGNASFSLSQMSYPLSFISSSVNLPIRRRSHWCYWQCHYNTCQWWRRSSLHLDNKNYPWQFFLHFTFDNT